MKVSKEEVGQPVDVPFGDTKLGDGIGVMCCLFGMAALFLALTR